MVNYMHKIQTSVHFSCMIKISRIDCKNLYKFTLKKGYLSKALKDVLTEQHWTCTAHVI